MLTDAACPGLRAVRLEKWGTVMYLLSNEGTENIRTEVTVAERGGLLLADLWTGKACRAASRQTENGTAFPLALRPCQVLLAAAEREEACAAAAEPAETAAVSEKTGRERTVQAETERFPAQLLQEPEDWTDRFVLTERRENRAVYEYRFRKETRAQERFLVRGEEMAECFCNGKSAGVSFFGPHVFEIGKLLQNGENEVRLIFTGSAANVYEHAGLPYGIGVH